MKEQAPTVAVRTAMSYSGRGGDIFVSEAAVETSKPSQTWSKTNQPTTTASEKKVESRPVEQNGPVRQERAYQAWREHYAKQDKKLSELPADERVVVFTAIKEGFKPQQETTRVKPPREEVLANSLLSDEDRLTKAEKVLREKQLLKEDESLSEEQQRAILEAHHYGQGQKGKDGSPAGVYNYTRAQLLHKIKLLDEAGFSKTERRVLIEAGIAAEPVDETGIIDPGLRAVITRINSERVRLGAQPHYSSSFLEKQIERIEDVVDANPAAADQAELLIDQLVRFRDDAAEGEHEARRKAEVGSVWYLDPDDKEQLALDPVGWLDSKFDQIFLLAPAGQAADSKILDKVATQLAYALDYVTKLVKEGRAVKMGDAAKLNIDFFSRYNAAILHTIIERGDVDRMGEAVFGLKAEGVGGALSLDDGGVKWMFNRMSQLMEDMRLRDGGNIQHINSAMVMRMQQIIVSEQTKLAENGLGVFANAWKLSREESNRSKKQNFEDKLKRSMYTAYSLFVCVGQLSLLNARGSYPPRDSAHRLSSSPGSTLPFNLENYLMQYGKLTPEQERFLRELKLMMADFHIKHKRKTDPKEVSEKFREDLGRRLFRDIAPPADVFSSGWRTADLLLQLDDLFVYKIENAAILSRFADEIYTSAREGKIKITREHGKEARKRPEEIVQDIIRLEEDGGILHPSNRRKLLQEEMIDMSSDARNNYLRQLGLRDANANKTPAATRLEGVAKERAKDFAMFMRLRSFWSDKEPKTDKQRDERAKLIEYWGKVKNYRTEEIVRLFRERAADEEAFQNLFDSEPFRSMFAFNYVQKPGLTEPQQRARERKQRAEFRYDEFKQKYGLVIQLVREQSWNKIADRGEGEASWLPAQVNFAQLSAEQIAIVDTALGAGEGHRLQQMFRAMQNFVDDAEITDCYKKNPNRHVIDALINDDRFTDIYTRSLLTDDTFLDELEVVPDNSGMITMSKRWGPPGKEDALVRYFSDIKDAKVIEEKTKVFIQHPEIEEKIKAVLEAASAVNSLNGIDNRAKYAMFTLGSLLEMCKAPALQDIAGIKKLMFEIPTTKIQEILGAHADPKLSDELRYDFNKAKDFFTGEGPEADLYVNELEKSLGITWYWITLKRTPRFLLYILLALIGDIIGTLEAETGAKKAA